MRQTLYTFLLLFGSFNFLFGQTTWTGTVDNNWALAGNWDNGLPASGNDATIPAAPTSGIFPVIVGAVTSDYMIDNSGTITLNAGATISNTSTFTNQAGGTLNFLAGSGVSNNMSGVWDNFGTMNLDGNFSNVDNATFTNKSGATVTSTAIFSNDGSAQFFNEGDFDNQLNFFNMSDFDNSGTFDNSAGSLFNNNDIATNSGTLTVEGNFFNFISFTNTGTLTIIGSFINNDVFKNEGSGILDITGSGIFNNNFEFLNAASASVTNDNQLNNFACATIINEGSTTNNSVLSNQGYVWAYNAIGGNAPGDFGTGLTFDPNNPIGTVCFDEMHDLDNSGSTITVDIDDLIHSQIPVCTNSYGYNPTGDLTFDCAVFGMNPVAITIDGPFSTSFTCTPNVQINDPNPAVPTCVSMDILIDASGVGTLLPADVSGGGTDNCNIINPVSVMPNSFGCSDVGSSPTVTLTVNDGHGNETTCSTTVNILDNTLPTALCSNFTVQLDGTGAASIVVADINNGSFDNCGLLSTTIDVSSFDCSNVAASVTVTLTATDLNSNINTCTAQVTVEDNEVPMAFCSDHTLQLGVAGVASLTTSNVDNNSSDNCQINTLVLSKENFDCSDVGMTAITLTVTDDAGNSADCMAQITVEDDVNPTAICQDATIQLDASGAASVAPIEVDGGSSDNCGIASMTVTPNSFDCNDIGSSTVSFMVTDVSGNQAICSAQVTIEDNVNPTAVCQDITIQLDAAGSATIVETDIDNGSSDACGIAFLMASQTSFDCSNIGSNSVVLTVEDTNENSSTCTADVTVEDNNDPMANCMNHTVQIGVSGIATITANDVDDGSTDNCAIQSLSVNPSTFDCNALGINSVVLTVTDVNGNSVDCNADVTVQTSGNLTAVCQNITVQLDAAGNASIVTADVDGGSTGSCGSGSTLTVSPNSFDCSNLGSNTVTLTITEGTASDNCTATVTIEDDLNPTAVCQDITVQLDAAGNGSIVAADIDGGSTDACGIGNLSAAPTNFTCADVGTTISTLTVTDANGNTSNCTANLIIEDNVPPMAMCQDFTVQLNAIGNGTLAASSVENGSTDACGVASFSVTPTNFTCADAGTVNATLTVTDVNGNSADCNAIITVEQNSLPVAICQDATVQLDANGNGTVNPADLDNGSSGGCGNITFSANPTNFTCADLGTAFTTFTVTDMAGRMANCSATITVEDNVDPTAVCQNRTVQLDINGNGTLVANDLDAGSTDACGIASISASLTSFTCAEVGTNISILTVNDVNGNSSICDATITVEDNIAPIANCQNASVQLDAFGMGSITANEVDGGSSDNCAIASISANPLAFDCDDLGTQSVTLTVTDVNGNSANCSANVTVSDGGSLIALCQNATVQLDGNGNASIAVSDIDNGSSGGCGTLNLAVLPQNFDCLNIGSNTVTLTASDAGMNTATCTATVTVEDNFPPNAQCVPTLNIPLLTNGTAQLTAAQIDNNSTDNCSQSLTFQLSKTAFDCTDAGATQTVTLTVSDGVPTMSTCTTQVTVVDLILPTAVCMNISKNLDASGSATVTASELETGVGYSDACGVATVSLNKTAFDCSNIGSNSVTVTVTDVFNNVNTCSALVEITDAILPDAKCQDLTIELDEFGDASLTAVQINNGSSDACGIASFEANQTDFGCNDAGLKTVQLTVTDNSGNENTCDAIVTIENNLPPIFNNAPVDMTVECGNIPPRARVFAYDNCSNQLMVTFSEREIVGNCIGNFTIERTWTAMAANGNMIDHKQTITIQDTEGPEFVNPPPFTNIIECTDPTIGIPSIAQLELSDCDPNAAIYDVIENWLPCDPNGSVPKAFTVIDREIIAIDDCGNRNSTFQKFFLVDRRAPELIFCPSDLTILGDQTTGAIVDWAEPIFIDDCGTDFYYENIGPGDRLPVGVHTVRAIAEDQGWNQTVCEFQVEIIDPFFVNHLKPIDVSIPNGSSFNTNKVDWNLPFALPCDACDLNEQKRSFARRFERLGEIEGHRYYLSTATFTPMEAQNVAEQYDGYVVSIENKVENDFLRHYLEGQEILIGFNDVDAEGSFEWSDQNSSAFTYWVANQPFSAIRQADTTDFVKMDLNGQWVNVSNGEYRFVMEVPCFNLEIIDTDIPQNQELPLGNYFTDYEVTDLCGEIDTTTVLVNVTPQHNDYCHPNRTLSPIDQDENWWITNTKIDQYNFESGNDNGYRFRPGRLFTALSGDAFSLTVSTQDSFGDPGKIYLRAWLDINGDNDFYDPGELVFDEFSYTGEAKTAIPIPTGTPTSSNIRLRVAASPYAPPEPCGDFKFGEVEDYVIGILNPIQTRSAYKTDLEPTVFPNPASDHITFSTYQNNLEKIEISNRYGQVWGEVDRNTTVNGSLWYVNTISLPAGLYQVKMMFEDRVPKIMQFVIVRE